MGGWRGRVAEYLAEKRAEAPLHFTLIDPDEVSGDPDHAARLVEPMVSAGTDVILVGGSIGVSERLLDEVIFSLKRYGIPVVLFPGNVNGLSKEADAVLFMSLLNSDDPYYIVGAQVQGAVIVKRYGLEALPTAYLIVGYGGAAGYIGRARPLPLDKPEIVAAYALAAELLGMRYIYLEAGSGAPLPIPSGIISTVRRTINTHTMMIVGGGIRSPEAARKAVEAGADVVVTGTIVEEDAEKAASIVRSIKNQDLRTSS